MSNDFSAQQLYDDLVKHQLIFPVGVPGAFGRGAVFEDVLQRFNDLVSRLAKDDGAETRVFPPILNREVMERTGYLNSFPHLAGAVFSFNGSELEAKQMSERAYAKEPWAEFLKMTNVVLTPAICYPVYATLAGELPADGRLLDVLGWAFRHEPSPEPTRMQAFRMREFIRVGSPDAVIEWRNKWHERGLELLLSLGLDAKSDVAADPFFGRGGRMLAANQKEQKLKFEVLVPVISQQDPTAVCSFNYHQDHFGKTFDIRTSDGEIAQTACLGFGMERVTMALFRTHGFRPAEWPKHVRERLWS
ncbi:MAG TPA: amino acid--[acyl-carrier-protein] ligase [Polyangiaceae bacterium]|nr:amino acid--[acyl-carrier-protein] ligase [Polyangiaceae bacterium]